MNMKFNQGKESSNKVIPRTMLTLSITSNKSDNYLISICVLVQTIRSGAKCWIGNGSSAITFKILLKVIMEIEICCTCLIWVYRGNIWLLPNLQHSVMLPRKFFAIERNAILILNDVMWLQNTTMNRPDLQPWIRVFFYVPTNEWKKKKKKHLSYKSFDHQIGICHRASQKMR